MFRKVAREANCDERLANNALDTIEKVLPQLARNRIQQVEKILKLRLGRDLTDVLVDLSEEIIRPDDRNPRSPYNVILQRAAVDVAKLLDMDEIQDTRRVAPELLKNATLVAIEAAYIVEEDRVVHDARISRRDEDDYRGISERGKIFESIIEKLLSGRWSYDLLRSFGIDSRAIDDVLDTIQDSGRGDRRRRDDHGRGRDDRDYDDRGRGRNGRRSGAITIADRKQQDNITEAPAEKPVAPASKENSPNKDVDWTPSVKVPHPVCTTVGSRARFRITDGVVQQYTITNISSYSEIEVSDMSGFSERIVNHGIPADVAATIKGEREYAARLEQMNARSRALRDAQLQSKVVRPSINFVGDVMGDNAAAYSAIFPASSPSAEEELGKLETEETAEHMAHYVDVPINIARQTRLTKFPFSDESDGFSYQECISIQRAINHIAQSNTCIAFNRAAQDWINRLSDCPAAQDAVEYYCNRVSQAMQRYFSFYLSEPRVNGFDLTSIDDLEDVEKGDGTEDWKYIWKCAEAHLKKAAADLGVLAAFDIDARWQRIQFVDTQYIAGVDVEYSAFRLQYPQGITVGAAISQIIHPAAAVVFTAIASKVHEKAGAGVTCRVRFNDNSTMHVGISPHASGATQIPLIATC